MKSIAVVAYCLLTVLASSQRKIELSSPKSVPRRSVQNIHVKTPNNLHGNFDVVFGSCELSDTAEREHHVASLRIDNDSAPDRLTWNVPDDIASQGCLTALQESNVVGRSNPVDITSKPQKRQRLSQIADPQGAWFDAVAYVQTKPNSSINSTLVKSSNIAILGAGMSGLFTSFLLSTVGMHNWHIYESSNRTGGRVKTAYFNGSRPDEYLYQEMGAMRFPWSITYDETNKTLPIMDSRVIWQLAAKLNEINGPNGPVVRFSRWIQASERVPSSEGIMVPDAKDLRNLTAVRGSSSSKREDPTARFKTTSAQFQALAKNVYQAHKLAVEQGDFHWSEANYLRYVSKLDANLTDIYTHGAPDQPLWQASPYGDFPFGHTEWLTIDQGLKSLPRAFEPSTRDKISYLTPVTGLETDEVAEKIKVQSQTPESTSQSTSHDFVIVAVPFSKVRIWHPMPDYSSLLSRGIQRLNYAQACKVALMYKIRFWEHLPEPIFGGCREVSDIPGLGSVCYPSYRLNSPLPGVLLASYTNDTICRSVGALNEMEHVRMVQAAMVDLHGQAAADNFVGLHERQIWDHDPHAAGAWASPTVDQQPLYLPAYFKTEHRTIFVGEHTSAVNAWVWSALESAVRGVVQLLLELGLVDEAREIVREWMARWIEI